MAAMSLPLVALAALTLAVWVRMYQLRFAEMARAGVAPQQLALSGPKADALRDTRASDNFRNLFELPVLFYAGVLVVLVLQLHDHVFLWMAWAYVVLRTLHSLIQCSYNRVVHRFVAYASSSVVLFALWGRIAWILL